MRAVALVGFPGTPTLVSVPRPRLTLATDVLVAVRAVATNPVDLAIKGLLRSVGFSHPEPLPTGFDAAGVVAECGAEVTGIKVGDEVYFVRTRHIRRIVR